MQLMRVIVCVCACLCVWQCLHFMCAFIFYELPLNAQQIRVHTPRCQRPGASSVCLSAGKKSCGKCVVGWRVVGGKVAAACRRRRRLFLGGVMCEKSIFTHHTVCCCCFALHFARLNV